ncbi:MAG TPA: acyltransferase family protein, partial [Burkholderiaceae bacterium]|nr:acyltransferase family protein [Burkholderiaceae bacterium]
MNYFMLPKITALNRTNLNGDSLHSLVISLVRGGAAIEVAIAHLRAQAFPGYKSIVNPNLMFQGLVFLSGFAHQAVVLFFLLSGWLVGGSLLNKTGNENAVKNYVIDRMTRLWVVLVPAFVLTLIFGILENKVSMQGIIYSHANEYSAFSFLGNMLGLQTIFFQNYGYNFSLWSLANETWYYILFPLLLGLVFAKEIYTKFLSGILILTIASFVSYPILLFFSLWLLGVVFSRIKIDASRFFQSMFFVVFCVVAVYFRIKGLNDDLTPDSFIQDAIYSISFLVFLSSLQYEANLKSSFIKSIRSIGKLFSEFSFSLYVIHIPIISLIFYYLSLFFNLTKLSSENKLHFMIFVFIF